MENVIKLTIIIPVFNGQDTIGTALESILFQDTNFDYEIIVVDDKSTDNTKKVVQLYQNYFHNIRILENEKNMGKGFSVMKAYEAALGDYFHILDADDYFISYNKLQKQVDFLDENPEYVAIAHNTILLFDDNRISFISNNKHKRSYSYEESISNKFYFHTSSYMYRKIQRKLPEIFTLEPMRGDSGLFFYHVYMSKKKVMYLPDVASVYHVHGKGIWSSMTNEEKYSLTKALYEIYLDKIIIDKSSFEYNIWNKKLKLLTEKGKYIPSNYEKWSIDEILNICRNNLTNIYSPNIRQEAFKGMYGIKIIDQLCEACGRIIINQKKYRLLEREYDNNKVAILVSGFSPKSGGVFKEISELIEILIDDGKSIDIYSTNQIKSDTNIITKYFDDPKINYYELCQDDPYSEQLEYLINLFIKSSPEKIYPFISHHDIILNSVIQRGLGKSITLDFVFDHGLSLGIYNSSIDKVIVKTTSQAEALSQIIPSEKLVLIPPFAEDVFNKNPYKPFQNDVFTTGSASARQYKIDSNYRYPFEEIIPRVLMHTKGKHIHFGPLQKEFKDLIITNLKKFDIDEEKFIHIDWVDNFPNSLIDKGVDLFIASFPIPSARILVDVMMAGIPIVYHKSKNDLMTKSEDFCDENQFSWETPSELLSIIDQISKETLIEKSKSARKYYETFNSRSRVSKMFIEESGFNFTYPHDHSIRFNDLIDTDFFELNLDMFNKQNNQNKEVDVKIYGLFKKLFSKSYAKKRRDYFFRKPITIIKSFFGRILPSPANTFHKLINDVIEEIRNVKNELQTYNDRINYHLREIERESKKVATINQKIDEIQSLKSEINKINDIDKKIDEIQSLKSEINKINDIDKKIDEINNFIIEADKLEEIQKEIDNIYQKQNIYINDLKNNQNYLSELLWAQIYNNTIQDSNWLINKSISPGRWAIGYPFLYILYRVLNDFQPKSILELGLGQSTKIISQYAESMENCKHYVVEHDDLWIANFIKSYPMKKNTIMCRLDINNLPHKYGDNLVKQYIGFSEKFLNHRFDLLLIDGPVGTTEGDFSRIDILKILPKCLADTFILMFDDTQRKGELNTMKKILEILSRNNINYFAKEYYSVKNFYLVVSEDLEFFTSL